MQLYPAIDLKDGQCVRLTQGRFDDAAIYETDPVQAALRWQKEGAAFLHLVDLDGARTGRSVNAEAVASIVRAVSIPVQLGGGIRTRQAAAEALKMGIRRVIVGTRAVKDPAFIRQLIEEFGPERIVAGIDARDGMAAVDGWETLSARPALELCLQMRDCGVRHIVYTDISRDGMLTGPNVEATRRLTEATGLDIIASGGISSMEDLQQLQENGIRGAIIGKALYEKRIDLRQAVLRFQNA